MITIVSVRAIEVRVGMQLKDASETESLIESSRATDDTEGTMDIDAVASPENTVSTRAIAVKAGTSAQLSTNSGSMPARRSNCVLVGLH